MPDEVPDPPFRSVRDLFEQSFEKYPNNAAFTNMGRTLTYGNLDRLSMQFACYLQNTLGLTRGERVAIMLPNILQYPVAMCGVFRAGLVVVNVNPLYTARELRHQLKDSGTKCVIILENFGRMFSRKVYEASIYGTILYLLYKLNITIIPTRNEQETALVVMQLARLSQKDSPLGEVIIPEPPKDLRSSQLYFLEGLYHVSEKSAIKLLDAFGSVQEVLTAIEETSFTYTKSGKVKGIAGAMTTVKGFGAKFVEKNQALIQTPYDDSGKIDW